jgi:hypothetical protein
VTSVPVDKKQCLIAGLLLESEVLHGRGQQGANAQIVEGQAPSLQAPRQSEGLQP